VFLDESGFLLIPNVLRTWAPRGKTPILRCADRWKKISAISAISISPRRRRISLYAHFHPEKNIKSPEVAQFLGHLLKHLRGPVVLLWDSGTPHKGAAAREFIRKHPRLHCYHFPGYAPELNPDEFIWYSLKRALSNSVPRDLRHLKQLLHAPLQRVRQSQKLLWSCIHASDLPWRK
jgi:transposase